MQSGKTSQLRHTTISAPMQLTTIMSGLLLSLPFLFIISLLTNPPPIASTISLSLRRRGIDSVCLFGASDADAQMTIDEFPSSAPSLAAGDPLRVVPPGGFGGAGNLHSLVLRCANVSDAGLESLLERFKTLSRLELSGR